MRAVLAVVQKLTWKNITARVGLAAFVFFLLKGIVWLVVAGAAALIATQ